jgi:uncharacterized circularly permuted ATP-grasp superfamily protein
MLIDWYYTARVLAALTEPSDLFSRFERWKELERISPTFRNIDYPVSPLPLLVSSSSWDQLRDQVCLYVTLLERVIRLYRDEEEVRAFFALNPVDESLAVLTTGLSREIIVCRLDCYVDAEGGGIRVLENNTDCPAGPLFTQRLNDLIDHGLATLCPEVQLAVVRLPGDASDAFLRILLGAAAAVGDVRTIGILQPDGESNLECLEMARSFGRAGINAAVVDPRRVERRADGLYYKDVRLDLAWNKINTVRWMQLIAESPSWVKLWTRAILDGLVCHVNGFGARYIVENKICSAFFHVPRFQHLFTTDEQDLITALVPWSAKLEPEATVVFEGERWKLRTLLETRQHDFVLKAPYDIRGAGVTIGKSVSRTTWLTAIEGIKSSGGIAQCYVRPAQALVVTNVEKGRVSSMPASLDFFVFSGDVALLGSKASNNDRLNVFQGGRKLAVRVVANSDSKRCFDRV